MLTDNGKVFTGRFGPGTGEVLFDRICRENGIRHILTAWLAGETVEVSVEGGLVSISHRGVLVATHAQRHRPAKEPQALRRRAKQRRPRPRQPTVGQVVTRMVDSSGSVSFAGAGYKAGNANRGRQV